MTKTFILFFLFPMTCPAQPTGDVIKKVTWSANGLQFDQFKLIKNREKPDSLATDAFTFCNLNYYYRFHSDSLFIKMQNSFNTDKSWVRKKSVGDTYLLKHEQGHFDISEIYARLFIERFLKYPFTKNFKIEIEQLFAQILTELKEANILYDQATDHSKRKEEQAEWNEKIVTLLKKLPVIANKEFCVLLQSAN
ncbi:MAG TPA: DUF922 domain-containing protein [Niabella sp.]